MNNSDRILPSDERTLVRPDHLFGPASLTELAARQARLAFATYGNIDLSAGEIAPASTGEKTDRKKRLMDGETDPNFDPILY